ncbi:MAG: SUMF1/EgtB/PvdO family nonheme iron enzyme [Anaerolineae bacterium]|nr:SUMF1/EgtB/PvdO family nonheme iron enzyme [Anaerolineae bacterium]
MSHIFISYSKKDHDYARKLADKLLSLGFDVWIDDQIDYGDDWWRVIVRAIRGAKAFIVVMTEESDASDWVQREVTLADKHKIPAFPIWLSGDVDASENWAIYVRTQYADVRDRSLPKDDYYTRLAKVAPRKSNQGNDITDSPPAKQSSVGITGDLEVKLIPKADTIQPKTTENLLTDVSALTAATLSILPPPFEWCSIPAGKVTIEYSKTDHKTFDVPAFLMAKYLITNAQYHVFITAEDGYSDPLWWDYSDHAKLWRKDSRRSKNTSYQGDYMPRINVSWYEAIAFTRWLTARVFPLSSLQRGQRDELNLTLPSEQQWQCSAQGDDNSIYPWGDDFDLNRCNTLESNINQPTPVAQYPSGVSSYGVFDMSGNVWEWSSTTWMDDLVELTGNFARVLRGGSFFNGQDDARATFRSSFRPDLRSDFIGFRIVSSLPSP